MNIDDYESLPTTSVGVNMTAGALAGILEHIVMYPLDSVKTRMQSLTSPNSHLNIMGTFQNMISREGLMRPIRGASAVILGAGPAHSLYFGVYEMTKEMLTKVTSHNHLNYVLSGCLATLVHDAISNPTEVIKQRMQMYNSPYTSVVRCMRDVYRKEGMHAFYRSYSTQLVMNIPYQTIHFTTYEFLQNMLNVERKYSPVVHMVAGAAAGASAAAITTPLDVVKTLLNTQETGLTKGMIEASRKIYRMAGPRGFFKGMTARVLYAMPATAICWSTYEFFKYYLCGMDKDKYKSSITGRSELQTPTRNTNYVLPKSDADEHKEETLDLTSGLSKDGGALHPAPPSVNAAGAIKTVCELSTRTAAPTINLHTRHTEVKGPYERGFSST